VRYEIVVMMLAACRGGGSKSHRAGSNAPVELVNEIKTADAGRAGTIDEVEPNDADEVATPLPLGGTLRGKVEPETDVDHVRLDVDKPGALQVTLSGVEGQDLVLEVEDAGGTVIARSDRGGARVKEGIPNLGVTPGRYTLVVRAVPKKKPARPARRGRAPAPEPEPPPAPVYELAAQLVPANAVKGQETEPDDDRGTANDLIVGDAVTGFIGWNGDADEWKLSVEALSEKNAIDVQVSAVEGVALEVEVADALGQPLVTRKGAKGGALAVRDLLPVVPQGGAPFYYITVRGAPSNPETTYQLEVSAHVVGTDAEIEPDDSVDKPYAIPADRTVVHGTWSPGDVDCYGLAVSAQPRTVDVTIDPKADLDVSAELLVDGKPALDAKGKPVPPVNHAGRGAAEKLNGQVPAGAHAVVRVRGEGTAEGAYDVTVADGE
jgi:hypothetical protein